jgi:hypothetical protein
MEQKCFLHVISRFYSIGWQLFTRFIYNQEEQRHAAMLFINSTTYATIMISSESISRMISQMSMLLL